MRTALLVRVLEWLLPGGGTRRRGAPAGVGPRAGGASRPRSPYACEAATDHRVDVTDEPLTRPYYRETEALAVF